MRNRINTLRPEFVVFIPQILEPGVIYISEKYRTASHQCACGCGEKVVTPLSPADWRLTLHGDCVSLHPSIGNWNYECRSHYWIRRNKIVWSGQMSAARIAYVQKNDRLDKARHVAQRNQAKSDLAEPPVSQPTSPDSKTLSLWERIWMSITHFLRRP